MSARADRRLQKALGDLATVLAGTGAPWMIIGGIAVIARGVRRFTGDIDATIRGDEIEARVLLAALAKKRIVPRIASTSPSQSSRAGRFFSATSIRHFSRVVTLAVVVSACGGAPRRASEQGRRTPITRCALREAPTETRYPVPSAIGDLVIDDASFSGFAGPVRRDAEAMVRSRGDAAARDALFVLAMLDALADRWPAAVAKLDRIRAVEPDPVKAVMTGLSIRVGADSRAHGSSSPDGYAAALERALSSLALDQVRDELAMLRAMGQTFTPDVCRALVADVVGPHVRAGTVGFDDAQTIVFQRYAAVVLAPVGAVFDRVLADHGIGLPGGAP